MRKPTYSRERPKKQYVPPGVSLTDVASRAKYVGSVEHKDTSSFAGHPRPRADASICDVRFANQQSVLTDKLRQEILQGRCGAPWEGDFPRYVWGEIDGQRYEARLTNKVNGEYKGYPISLEMP